MTLNSGFGTYCHIFDLYKRYVGIQFESSELQPWRRRGRRLPSPGGDQPYNSKLWRLYLPEYCDRKRESSQDINVEGRRVWRHLKICSCRRALGSCALPRFASFMLLEGIHGVIADFSLSAWAPRVSALFSRGAEGCVMETSIARFRVGVGVWMMGGGRAKAGEVSLHKTVLSTVVPVLGTAKVRLSIPASETLLSGGDCRCSWNSDCQCGHRSLWYTMEQQQ